MKDKIDLIVGLGNPGPEYERTRHNAGTQCLSALLKKYSGTLKNDKKFFGLTAKISIQDSAYWCLLPTTFMNHSGKAIAAMANFYNIAPQQILIIHDELDLPAGVARFKFGGGHGGQNGLRDIINALGQQQNFYRLRIGIGRPEHKSQVTSYVLGKAPEAQAQLIDQAIDDAITELPTALSGHWTQAMNRLHAQKSDTQI